jgi:hypothetical protein
MRKLTLLATTAIAALALTAAMAAPANADRAFEVVHPNGSPCNPCVDTGQAGTIAFRITASGATGSCDVAFDNVIYWHGALEATDVEISNCTLPGLAGTNACTGIWPGQLTLPDTGPAEIDLDTCLNTGAATVTHTITYQTFNNPRRWEQLSASYNPLLEMVDSNYQDYYTPDNIGMTIL